MSRLYPKRPTQVRPDNNLWHGQDPIYTRSKSPELRRVVEEATLAVGKLPVGGAYTYETTAGRARLLSNMYLATKVYLAAQPQWYLWDWETKDKNGEPVIDKTHPEYGWGPAATHSPAFIIHTDNPTVKTALDVNSPPPPTALCRATFIVTRMATVQAEEKLRIIHAVMTQQDMTFAPGVSYNKAVHHLKRVRALIGIDPVFHTLPDELKKATVTKLPDRLILRVSKDRDPKTRIVDDLERELGFAPPKPMVRTTEIELDTTWQPQAQATPETTPTPAPTQRFAFEISPAEEERLFDAFGQTTPEILRDLARWPSLEELAAKWGPQLLDLLSPESLDQLPTTLE